MSRPRGPVERRLEELRRTLPVVGRDRLLAEAEDHLREAAARVGEEEAVARFGSADDLARQLAPLRVEVWTRLAAVSAAVAALSFLLAYPVYENNLPPAPWPTAAAIPDHLAWKRDAVVLLMLVTCAAAAAGLVGLRGAAPVLLAAPPLLGAVGLLLTAQWDDAVPGTPDWLLLVALGQLALCLVPGVCSARASLLARATP